MDRNSVLKMSDDQIMEVAWQLRVGYRLKRTLRYSTTRNFKVHNESVAEHVFALFYLGQFFLPLEDPQRTLNIEKLHQILLFHDFGEILNGDIPYHLKTREHEIREQEDAKQVFASLPEVMQNVAQESWHEYELRQSPEAVFAYALDKIESMFELLDPVNEQSMMRLTFTFKDHIERKIRATESFPVMRRFVEVVSRDMNERGVFWSHDR